MSDLPVLGVAGLGRMGSAAVKRLIERGYTVRTWNRSPGKERTLEALGAMPCESPRTASTCSTRRWPVDRRSSARDSSA